MKKTLALTLLMTALTLLIAPAVFAAEGAISDAQFNYYAIAVLGCGVAIGFAALGTGIGMGAGLGRACEGVARNPGVSGKIMTTLIVGLAMIESLCIYALVVVLIVLYANPFGI